MLESLYLSLMQDWLFSKSSETEKFVADKLGYNEAILKVISQMKIGECVIIQNYALKRIS